MKKWLSDLLNVILANDAEPSFWMHCESYAEMEGKKGKLW
jgi:hypothetical protein